MKPGKKQHPSQNKDIYSGLTFLIDAGGSSDSQENLLYESLLKLKPEYKKGIEFIVISDASEKNLAEKLTALPGGLPQDQVQIIGKTGTSLKPILTEAVEKARFEHIAVLRLCELKRSFSINELVNYSSGKFSNQVAAMLNPGVDEKNRFSGEEAILFLKKDIAGYCFSSIPAKSKSCFEPVRYILRHLGIPLESAFLAQANVSKDNKYWEQKPAFHRRLANRLMNFYQWFVKTPIAELKTKPQEKFSFIKDNSINRLIFAGIATILFFLMPIMAVNTSPSGDEDKHVDQAPLVLNYFLTLGKDTSYMNCPIGPFYAYPLTYDVAMDILIKVFHVYHYYEMRHVFNALTGWMTVLFTGLIACLIAGWRPGIMAMLLLVLTPSFLGHSYNNPKDIPFAFTYVFTLYYMFKLVREYPEFTRKIAILTAIGIGLSLNIRPGGLVMIPYLVLFLGLVFLSELRQDGLLSNLTSQKFKKTFLIVLFITLAGYFLGIITWPYAYGNPVKHPFEALKIMTNFSVSLRQIFEGKFIWSDNVPWYYEIKYILITVPLVVFAGLFFFIALFEPIWKKYRKIWLFMVVFSFVFPIFWIIYKKSNVYGGWRHLLFAYAMITVAAAIGFERFLQFFRKKKWQYLMYVPILAGAVGPVAHIIRNYPCEYIYYNELVGGVKGAYGQYETDYYYHGVRGACMWLKDKIKQDPSLQKKDLVIATNFTPAVIYYFRDMKEKVKITYVRYYDRGESNWDFAIIANSYLNPAQLRQKYWPPKNTIHTIDVDKMPICAVIERGNKDDYEGVKLLGQKNYPAAIDKLTKALAYDPHNESALLNLTQAYIENSQPDSAIMTANQCLKVYPDYDKGLNLLGIAHLNKYEYGVAISIFKKITKVNPKFVNAYYNIGITYKTMNDAPSAVEWLQEAINVNRKYKPSYYALAEILNAVGRQQDAQRVLQMAAEVR